MALLLASAFDQSKYLRAEDIKQPTKFRIASVTEEVLNDRKTGKPENKLVVYFTTTKKGLVLNKTNNRAIRGAFGDDTAGWEEKIVVLFTTPTDTGPGLRVRIPPPKQPQTASQRPMTPGNGAAEPVAPPATAAAAPLVAVVPLAAAAPPAAVVADPELEPDPVLSLQEEMDDEIGF